ncbi:MAG: hypothetical protein PHX70_05745 [Clostridium sp.]|nr:hypothetical protein [Clostridium sp.]
MSVNAFSRFVVEGYENGNLKIRKLQSEENDDVINDKSEDIDDILSKFAGEDATDEDLSIMKSLLKHNIPLTKENISYEKSIIGFKNSIMEDPKTEEHFIDAYLKGKGIDENSSEASQVRSTIKGFFSELKGMNIDEITTFIENGLDFTDENIKSFKNIFQKDASISKDINGIKQEIEKLNTSKIEPKEAQIDNKADVPSSKISAKDVLNEINAKMNDMKDTIRQLTSFSDLNKSGMENILNTLNKNINDFKVFNAMSDGYYYMDVPVNLKDNEYNCKLIIKDDRKSGKKIDTKNVKIATSVKTINMGVVDAYITILNKNLKVDIKADKKWINVLDLAKVSLMGKFYEKGYNINVNVDNKEEELNIVTCRNFFNNDKVGNLDIRV